MILPSSTDHGPALFRLKPLVKGQALIVCMASATGMWLSGPVHLALSVCMGLGLLFRRAGLPNCSQYTDSVSGLL